MTWRWPIWMASPLFILILAYGLTAKQPAASPSSHAVPTQKKVVALTFDDGPSKKFTPAFLQLLSRYHAHATFFVLGMQAVRYPSLIKAIAAQGSLVANHGWAHLNSKSHSAAVMWEDAQRTQRFVKSLGVTPTLYYRPPYGYVSGQLLDLFDRHGYRIVYWSIDPRDWARPGSQHIISTVLHSVQPGAIILLHDGGGNRMQTLEALQVILQQLSAQGYHCVTLTQLLKDQSPRSLPAGSS
ncbi:MAG: polysaccharide deacetylase family protein [Firmicutes bacterium]|nr:polysaccharide deacetylase family protein [Bacillota bacterium]